MCLSRGAEEHQVSLSLKAAGTIMTAMTPPQKPSQHWMVFMTLSAVFLLGPQPHIGGTEIQTVQAADTTEFQCLSKKQKPINHQDKSPQIKKALQEKAWWNEETCRTQDWCKTTMADVLLPLTEFQNRIPKCHWGCSWKQLHVSFPPPIPFQTDYTPTEQQPGVQRQGRFLLSYTNHADSLQDLKAGIFIWGDRRRNFSHKEHWHQSQ